MFRGFWRVGKESGVPFEEGGVGKEAIKGVGGIVDIGLLFFPPNRGLLSDVINFVWVISRGNDYGCVRGGGLGLEGPAEVWNGERVGVLCGDVELLE